MTTTVKLFDREWQKEGNALTRGEARLDFNLQRGCASPKFPYYSLKSKKGLLALEIEIRAMQDNEEDNSFWLTERNYAVVYGSHGVSISEKQDPYGAHTIFRASGTTLQAAMLDLARRL